MMAVVVRVAVATVVVAMVLEAVVMAVEEMGLAAAERAAASVDLGVVEEMAQEMAVVRLAAPWQSSC